MNRVKSSNDVCLFDDPLKLVYRKNQREPPIATGRGFFQLGRPKQPLTKATPATLETVDSFAAKSQARCRKIGFHN